MVPEGTALGPVCSGTFRRPCGLQLRTVVLRRSVSGADDEQPVRAPEPAAAPKARKPEVDEDALELDDLDAHGVEGVVARMRGGADDGPVDAPAKMVQRGRTPVLSVLVTLLGGLLLAWIYPDFRYWLRSNEPHDLGDAADIAKNGKMPDGLHDQHVRISGTPDVRHAARLTTRNSYVGYLRITEGGGSLFAAIPRGKDEKVRDEFEGVFEGRMLRLDRAAGADWIEQYLRDENVIRTIDAEPSALWPAIEASGDARKIVSAEGAIAVALGERVRLVVHPPDARVQLGLDSYPRAEDAERLVASLGYPYIAAGKGKAFHSFVARIPEAEREAALAKLQAGIEVPASNTDPRKGALVLPGTVAFSAALGDYALRGDDVLVPKTGDTGPVLYDVVGTTLVPRADADGFVAIPRDWVSAVRIEQPILLDRDGYLVVVGDTPSNHRLLAGAWLVIAVLVGLNVASLAAYVRRRASVA
jgi:hypothetical protein